MPELVDRETTPTAPAGAAASGRGQRDGRNVVTETITIGERGARESKRDGGETDVIQVGSGRSGRVLSTAAKAIADNIDKYGTAEKPDDDATPLERPAPKTETTAPAPAKPAEPKIETPPAAAATAPGPPDEAEIANERLLSRNRDLLAENESLKASGGKGKREPSKREKALDDVERMYPDDSVGAIRRLLAVVHEVDDPAHKDIDESLKHLYQDLTAKELGVSLDEAKQAIREAARNRLLLKREQRERKADAEAAAAPTEDPETKRATEMSQLIGGRLASKQADGKTLAERYPLMTKFAERLGGAKAEAQLWKGIKAAIAAGEVDPKTDDIPLIEHVAKQLETHYQALADEFVQARTPTPNPTAATVASTAQPTTTDAKDSKASPPGNGARTITTRDASVAPATSPAARTDQPKTETEAKPTWRNEKERREQIARRMFDS